MGRYTMFYVGIVSSFANKKEAVGVQCSVLEKLGHSLGRAHRFLNTHPPKEINGARQRAVVFVLPDGFRLRNDLIQLSIRQYKCSWEAAKFHIYREAAHDVMGNRADWLDLFPPDAPTDIEPAINPTSSTHIENVGTDPVVVLPQ